MLFCAALAAVLAALVSPIDRLGEQILTMHMVQHLLLIDVVPILAILAFTRVLLRPATRRLQSVERAAGPLAHPAFAVVAYAGVMWAWHIPALYDRAAENAFWHVSEHATMTAAGGLYWWHLLSPIRSRLRLGGLGPIVYMVSAKLVVGMLGIVLAFAPDALYGHYEDQPRHWGLTADADQSVAGLVMALEQSIVMGIALVWLFLRMLGESDRDAWKLERYGAG